MKLNLGCGKDRRAGYVNVDFYEDCDQKVDLSQFPWPWADGSASEIIMLDFLEHFPYRETDRILSECWRVLVPDGVLEVQVPDFDECARAVMLLGPFLCNRCGWEFPEFDVRASGLCGRCKQSREAVSDAAVHRLYGGQDRPGNYHYTAFNERILRRALKKAGFHRFEQLEFNENGETYRANWNIKIRAYKNGNLWND